MKSAKKYVLKKIILNNRLSEYSNYINYAKDNGYSIRSMRDFYFLEDKYSGKNLVLRHDVDFKGISVRKMFEIEKKLGVKSTYYFRFSTIDISLIHEMLENGFEVGLHFETIADYIRETGCREKDEIDINVMRMRLANDIKKFEEIIGSKISSCCSHGAEENIRLGISNNVITEKQDMKTFSLDFEAYDYEMYSKYIDCHIMDANVLFNCGFAYKDTPINAIDEGRRNIIFLSHPNHWYESLMQRGKELIIWGLGRVQYTSERKFIRISDEI